jgi:hypothetical protein
VPRRVAILAPLALALIAGCGGGSGSAPDAPDRAAGAPEIAQQAPAAGAQAGKGEAPAAAPGAVSSGNGPSQGRKTAVEDREHQPAATAGNPCRLVTRSEAGAIVGRAVGSPVVAPQGPTCIYPSPGTRKSITLAIAALDVTAVKRASRSVIQADVAGRRAYCVDYGGLKLLVPLAGGRVLNVSAPCPIASRFAATALGRLGA